MTAMCDSAFAPSRFEMRRLLLRFRDDGIEGDYVEHTLERTLGFCRIAWASILVLGGAFGFLDKQAFGPNAGTVLWLRGGLLALALIAIGISFWPRWRKYMVGSSAAFITCIGFFCTFLVALDDPELYSPYSTGLFFGFAAIFTTAGVGFAYSLFAMVLNLLVFDVVVGVIDPVARDVFIVYNFFLPGIALVVAYAGYLVERISRENYATSRRLADSLADVKRLSGLLPICASCNRIRSDDGYWERVESYISLRSEAEFSHGICPECVGEFLPTKDLPPTG